MNMDSNSVLVSLVLAGFGVWGLYPLFSEERNDRLIRHTIIGLFIFWSLIKLIQGGYVNV